MLACSQNLLCLQDDLFRELVYRTCVRTCPKFYYVLVFRPSVLGFDASCLLRVFSFSLFGFSGIFLAKTLEFRRH